MWSSPDWYFSRAASNPSDQPRLPTTAPQIRQSTSLPPTRTRRTSRNGPSHTKPQNHTAKDPFAAAKNNTERAPRGRKPPRNRGASRPPSSSRERGFEAPVPHQRVPRRTLASQPPRGRRDSDRSSRKPGSNQAQSKAEAPLPAYACLRLQNATSQHQFYCQEPVAPGLHEVFALQELQSRSVPAEPAEPRSVHESRAPVARRTGKNGARATLHGGHAAARPAGLQPLAPVREMVPLDDVTAARAARITQRQVAHAGVRRETADVEPAL